MKYYDKLIFELSKEFTEGLELAVVRYEDPVDRITHNDLVGTSSV